LAKRGKDLRAITREVGVSRNTVRRYLRDGDAERYRPRPQRSGKLAAFDDYIAKRFAEAAPDRLAGTVVLRERQERGKRGRRIDPPGFDGGKTIKGRKMHFLVYTQGLLMHAIVHAADIQDRDGGVLVIATLFGLYPFLLRLYADAGYQGPMFQQGLARTRREVNVEIMRRCDTGKFMVLPKRWIVERTVAWLNRCRRLS
jgi:transposase